MIGLAWLEADFAGATTTVVSGLTATPTAPTSLTINLASGRIYELSATDSTSYGSLPSDNTLIMQQGNIAAEQVTLSTSALSAGQNQWALIQISFAQVDNIPSDDPNGGIPYFWNSANPSQPLQGQGGSGDTIATRRQGTATINILYGSPATTGSEVPPSPSAGFVPLYLTDLTYGQTQITSGQILTAAPSVGTNVPSNYPRAPFLAGLLNQHHKGITGQAPQIDLTAEVKNILPLTNLPASDTTGGLPTMRLYAGNPNGNVAGNANVNGASDLCYDTVDKILYLCTTTGTISTAIWTAVIGSTTSQFAGGTTAGTANAQTIPSTTPAGFSLTAGYVVTATIGSGLTNSGSTTLNVDSTGAVTINKNTGSGNVPLTGGELVAGAFVQFIYTGTVWLLQAQTLGALATLGIGAFLENVGGNLTVDNGLTLGSDGTGALTVLAGSVTTSMLTAAAAAQRAYVAPTSTQSAGNLTLANDGTSPNFVVDIAAGRVSADSDATLLQLGAAMTKRLDESWAPGTGNGACDVSTKGDNQTWHAYLIGVTGLVPTAYSRTSNVASLTIAAHNLGVGSTVRVRGLGLGFDGLAIITAVTTNTLNYSNAGSNVGASSPPATALVDGFDSLFSQSYASPTMPSGWTVKQCLGSVLTDGSANLRPFTQIGNRFLLTTPINNISAIAPGDTLAHLVAMTVPLGVSVEVDLNFTANNAGSDAYISSPLQADQAPSTSAAPGVSTFTNAAGALGGAILKGIVTNTSGQIRYRLLANGQISISTLGWLDPRRRMF